MDFRQSQKLNAYSTDSREALDAIITFGTTAGLPPSIDTYHAAGFYEVTADNINAVNRSFLNLAKGAPAISDISTAIETAEHNLACVKLLADAIANEGDITDFVGLQNYVPTLTSNDAAGLVYKSNFVGWGQPYRVFDKQDPTGDNVGTAYRTWGTSENYKSVIGWMDVDSARGPAILERAVITHRNYDGSSNYQIGDFTLQGYDPLLERWEDISFVETYNNQSHAVVVEVDIEKAFSGFRLEISEQGSTHGSIIIPEIYFETRSDVLFDIVGLSDVEASNMLAVSEAISNANTSDLSTLSDYQNIVSGMRTSLKDDALGLVQAYAEGGSVVPSTGDLLDLGIDNVDTQNIDALRTIMISSSEVDWQDEAAVVTALEDAVKEHAYAQIMSMIAGSRDLYDGALTSFVPTISNIDDPDFYGMVLDSFEDTSWSGDSTFT
jgi:hypothetical protein